VCNSCAFASPLVDNTILNSPASKTGDFFLKFLGLAYFLSKGVGMGVWAVLSKVLQSLLCGWGIVFIATTRRQLQKG
jgi:uncharacterized membrane protein